MKATLIITLVCFKSIEHWHWPHKGELNPFWCCRTYRVKGVPEPYQAYDNIHHQN